MRSAMLLLLALPGLGMAQTASPAPRPVPPELNQLRQQFALRALTVSKTLAEQYASALGTLAREVGAEGDYEQALTAQKLRQELADLYARSLNDTTLSNVVVLKPADARPVGTVSYDRNSGDLVNWKAVGNLASWDVQKLVPGKYDIVITYSVAPMGELPTRLNPYSLPEDLSTGGEFEFFEDSSLAGASMNRRTGQVRDTGGWDKPATLQLAAINLTRTSARFGLKITRVNGGGGVMRLKEVRLVPAKEGETAPPTDPNAPTPGPAVPVDEVARIRESYLLKVQNSVRPLVETYLGKVRKMVENARAQNNEELAADLEAETRGTQRLLDNPGRIVANSNAAPPAVSLRGQGFTEWEGATYVPSANNTGDTFLLSYQGETVPVRLLWVTCPPPSDEARAQARHCAIYFGLPEEEVYQVGRQAQAFTEAFLQGRPLKVHSRGEKDETGHLLVAVQPDGVGDFAGVLVDNGLACVNPPKARGRAAKRFEDLTLANLKDREKQARARPIPPGAWAAEPDADPITTN